jgi:hypothetical protein
MLVQRHSWSGRASARITRPAGSARRPAPGRPPFRSRWQGSILRGPIPVVLSAGHRF